MKFTFPSNLCLEWQTKNSGNAPGPCKTLAETFELKGEGRLSGNKKCNSQLHAPTKEAKNKALISWREDLSTQNQKSQPKVLLRGLIPAYFFLKFVFYTQWHS